MKTIQALIFDFAGVLAVDGYWSWLRENVEEIELHRETLHAISVRADRGEISPEEFMEQVGLTSGVPASRILPEVLARIVVNKPLVRLIESLHSKYRIGLLSNFVYEWLDAILEEKDLYRLFDTVTISSQVGMVKPEPTIYLHTCAKLGIEPAAAIFVDDRESNVLGAEAVGMTGIRFSDTASLERYFIEHGVSPS